MSDQSRLRTYCVMAVCTLADGILLIDRGVRESVTTRYLAVGDVIQHTLLDEGEVEVPAIGAFHTAVLTSSFRERMHALMGQGSEEIAAEALSLTSLCANGKATPEQMAQLKTHLLRLKSCLKEVTPVLRRTATAA